MTLKHVVDHILCFSPVKHEKDCPTPTYEPFWSKLNEQANNKNIKYYPYDEVKLPEPWKDWRSQVTPEELEKMDLSFEFCADLTHKFGDPVAFQPAKAESLQHYRTFLISPSLTYTHLRIAGRGYTFSDRFMPEQLIILTQIQAPGAMDEPDPIKRLFMFSVQIEIRGRIHIMKSLSLAKGTIRSQTEIQQREINYRSFQGAQNYLRDSIFKRVEHYVDPKLSARIFNGQ